jgi:predicted nucleic acid-binding protein
LKARRDPDDDKFLETAIAGEADCLVTGDGDLLVLDPFRGVRILTARAFLEAR